jgi:hypothetical protein
MIMRANRIIKKTQDGGLRFVDKVFATFVTNS